MRHFEKNIEKTNDNNYRKYIFLLRMMNQGSSSARNKANCPHVGPGSTGVMHSLGSS